MRSIPFLFAVAVAATGCNKKSDATASDGKSASKADEKKCGADDYKSDVGGFCMKLPSAYKAKTPKEMSSYYGKPMEVEFDGAGNVATLELQYGSKSDLFDTYKTQMKSNVADAKKEKTDSGEIDQPKGYWTKIQWKDADRTEWTYVYQVAKGTVFCKVTKHGDNDEKAASDACKSIMPI